MRPASLLLFCCFTAALAQTEDRACSEQRNRITRLVEQTKNERPIAKFQSYFAFLEPLIKSAADRPNECGERDLRVQTADIERALILLDVAGQRFAPRIVMHCESIGPGYQCRWYEGDDTLQTPEDRLTIPTPVISSRRPAATLQIDSQYGGKLLDFAGASEAALRRGQKLVRLQHHDATVDLTPLAKYRDPLLVAIIDRSDSLRFRKVVWALRKMR